MPTPRLLGTHRVSALIAAAALAACASPPEPKPLSAEQILKESQGMARLGQRHLEGENMVRQGEGLVKEGQAKVAEGQRLIEAGKKLIDESEQGYGELRK
jgi:hypothetical protein